MSTAHAVSQVLRECFPPLGAPTAPHAPAVDVSELGAGCLGVAEAALGLGACRGGRHALRLEIARLHLQMECHLVVYVGRDPGDRGGQAEEATQTGNALHGTRRSVSRSGDIYLDNA